MSWLRTGDNAPVETHPATCFALLQRTLLEVHASQCSFLTDNLAQVKDAMLAGHINTYSDFAHKVREPFEQVALARMREEVEETKSCYEKNRLSTGLEEATEAIQRLNGSTFKGTTIVVDAWTTKRDAVEESL